MNHEILFMGKRLDTGQWVYGSLVQMLVDGRVASCIATVKEVGRANKDVPPMGILFTLNKDIFLVDPDTVGPYTGAIGKIPAEQRQSGDLEDAARNIRDILYLEEGKRDAYGNPYFLQDTLLKGVIAGANYIIDKACEWLRENAELFVWCSDGELGLSAGITDNFTEYFREAMEIGSHSSEEPQGQLNQ